jgi:DUF971 family protein
MATVKNGVPKRPVEVKRIDGNLNLRWSDQSSIQIPLATIRKNCSCAVCLEMKVALAEGQSYYQRAIRPVDISAVGNYALQIAWEDGHRSIVAFDRLETLAV